MIVTPARPAFPTDRKKPRQMPLGLWYVCRAVTLATALALIVLLLVRPGLGLALWWGFLVSVLPLVFLVAPSYWRNVCPMATLNQLPHVGRFSRGISPPAWLRQYGYAISVILFLALAASRKVIFDTHGGALALLLLAGMGAAFVGGVIFSGKSGWCTSVCPLGPVERLYGQAPFQVVMNAHCRPCVGCTKNCYDVNPWVASHKDITDRHRGRAGYRKFFTGAFPGFIVGFYAIPNPPVISTAAMYACLLLCVLLSATLYLGVGVLTKVSPVRLSALFGAIAFNVFYWYATANFVTQVPEMSGWTIPDSSVWLARGVVLSLSLVWLARTYRGEPLFQARYSLMPEPSDPDALRRLAAIQRGAVPSLSAQPRIVALDNRTLIPVSVASGPSHKAWCHEDPLRIVPVRVSEGQLSR